jgi:hypothetical protein
LNWIDAGLQELFKCKLSNVTFLGSLVFDFFIDLFEVILTVCKHTIPCEMIVSECKQWKLIPRVDTRNDNRRKLFVDNGLDVGEYVTREVSRLITTAKQTS